MMSSERSDLLNLVSTGVRRPTHLPDVELFWAKVDRAYPTHVALSSKVALVSGGAKSYGYRRKTWLAPPGSLLLAEAGEAHSGRPVREPYDVFMLSLENQALLAKVSFGNVVVNDPLLARTFRSLCAAIMNGNASALAAEEHFHALVAGLEHRSVGNRDVQTAREPAAVRRAREMLHDLFATRLSLDELVDHCRVPKSRFLRSFKETVGVPPHEYQLQLRVEHAKRMIASGSRLAEASAATGFFDQSHFHRHFARIVGIAPGEYRAACGRANP